MTNRRQSSASTVRSACVVPAPPDGQLWLLGLRAPLMLRSVHLAPRQLSPLHQRNTVGLAQHDRWVHQYCLKHYLCPIRPHIQVPPSRCTSPTLTCPQSHQLSSLATVRPLTSIRSRTAKPGSCAVERQFVCLHCCITCMDTLQDITRTFRHEYKKTPTKLKVIVTLWAISY